MIVVVTTVMLFMNQHTLGLATNFAVLLDVNNLVSTETLHTPEFGRRATPPRAATTSTILESTETQPVPAQTPYFTSLTSEDALTVQPESTGQEDKGCLKFSYNSTQHIYRSDNYVYDIWFRSLSTKARIQLEFDFSVSALNLLSPIVFDYSITSERWHRLQVFRSELPNDCTSAQLMIPGVAAECLSHSTPSLLRVSSADNRSLVIWSNCSAQGSWWNDVIEFQPLVQTSTELYMWLSIGMLMILVPLAIYACCLQYQLIKGRSAESPKESIYEEWNHGRPTSTPCSSNYSNKFTVQTSLASI